MRARGREHEGPNAGSATRTGATSAADSAASATRAQRVAALQRAVGNRALAPLMRRPSVRLGAAAGPVLQRKGVIRTAVDTIGEKWRAFGSSTDRVEGVLFEELLPLLESHTKAGGMTGKQKNVDPGSWIPWRRAIVLDPRKADARRVALGLEQWIFSASEGAERYYAEMRQAIAHFGPPSLDWQFGISDLTEPDVHNSSGVSLEIKRTTTHTASAIDAFIRAARAQSCGRVTRPNGMPFTGWRTAVELTSSENPWPFTHAELKHKKLTPRDIPAYGAANQAELVGRVKARNLAPNAQIPLTQMGKHEIAVTWLSQNPPALFSVSL
jgi:hypothetical protein